MIIAANQNKSKQQESFEAMSLPRIAFLLLYIRRNEKRIMSYYG